MKTFVWYTKQCTQITKSRSKYLSVGVKQLADYDPVLKIHNRKPTSAITFSLETFEDFLRKMDKVCEMKDGLVVEDQILTILNGYGVVMYKYYSVQFLPHHPTVG